MKASELRIGFYYMYNGSVFEMDRTTLSRILILGDEYEYEPIPLTEEWLIKFGFKFDVNKGGEYEGQKFEDRPLWYLKRPDDSRFCVYLDLKTCYVSIPCEFVHELQNAFFTVERKELTINEGE